MAEHVAQSDEMHGVTQDALASIEFAPDGGPLQEVSASTSSGLIIWTPRFIVIFALVLVVGLSLASVLVQGYLNDYYPAERVLLVFDCLTFCYWGVLVFSATTEWVRFGAFFGSIWSLFTAMNLVVTLLAADPYVRSTVAAHLHAASSMALLGCFVCLSISRTPMGRWDNWFFVVTPLLSICVIAVCFLLLTPVHSLRNLENVIANVMLFSCIITWWGRPSCWHYQPGPSLLFGLVPLIQLAITLPSARIVTGDIHFFYSQLAQLCILLAIMRLIQGEVRRRAAHPNSTLLAGPE